MSTNLATAAQATIASDFLAVRRGLATLLEQRPLCDVPDECRGIAEVVLAEVLNNVVEHAYADTVGLIDVVITMEKGNLRCQITDQGRPMPDHQAPGGVLQDFAEDDPPEGGFGWFMIRSLTTDLTYSRGANQNQLRFLIAANA